MCIHQKSTQQDGKRYKNNGASNNRCPFCFINKSVFYVFYIMLKGIIISSGIIDLDTVAFTLTSTITNKTLMLALSYYKEEI